jgi:hypothetical protein
LLYGLRLIANRGTVADNGKIGRPEAKNIYRSDSIFIEDRPSDGEGGRQEIDFNILLSLIT